MDSDSDPFHALDPYPHVRETAAAAAYRSEMTPQQIAQQNVNKRLEELRAMREWAEKTKPYTRASIELYNKWFTQAKNEIPGIYNQVHEFYISHPENGYTEATRLFIKYEKLNDFLEFLRGKNEAALAFALLDKMKSLPRMILHSEAGEAAMGGSKSRRKSNKKSRRKSNKKSRRKSNKKSKRRY
jgi:hypothetical protein